MHSNTDNFREAAMHFKEFGRYTNYPLNGHPSSQYMKFWAEEKRRCLEGLNLGYDWIPGYFYFYLNYCPIWIVESSEGSETNEDTGNIRSQRIQSFPLFWDSDYEYFHYLEEAEKRGQHAAVLKTRGRGYSFKGGSMLARNYFLVPGSKSYAVAFEKEYLTSDGLLTKAWDFLDFVDQNTPWSKRRQYKDTDMHKRASYQANLGGVKSERGFKSEIIGISLRDNPNRIRGKRGKLILFEEAGKCPGLLKAWEIARNSMEQGRMVYGLMVAFGTGGTEGADFESLNELFLNSSGYNIHTVDNRWSHGGEGTRCAFFVPEYMNREGYYDENGNSDVTGAKEEAEQDREKVRANAKDPNALTRHVAEKPFTPEEATMNVSGNEFPVYDLKKRLAELELNPKRYSAADYVVRFNIGENGEVTWEYDKESRSIYKYPHRDKDNTNGAIVVYEWPYRNNEGQIPYKLYIAGIDPYDQDDSTTTSLGATYIMNQLNERIVAEYVGRPRTAHEYYENVRRLLMFYNASANYENNLKGIFDYFSSKNCTYLLADEPRIIKDVIQESSVRRKKGTHATVQINQFGRELIKKWLLSPAPSDDTGALNLSRIRSTGLLEELILWNPKANFDRVSALGMLMILRQDLVKIEIQDKLPPGLESDPFWNRVKNRYTDRRFMQRNTYKDIAT